MKRVLDPRRYRVNRLPRKLAQATPRLTIKLAGGVLAMDLFRPATHSVEFNSGHQNRLFEAQIRICRCRYQRKCNEIVQNTVNIVVTAIAFTTYHTYTHGDSDPGCPAVLGARGLVSGPARRRVKGNRLTSATPASGSASELGRWIEPELADPAAFYAEHSETVVPEDVWAKLEPEIKARAAALEYDPELRRDVAAHIRLRIIEAATASRSIGPDGEQIYDYLKQAPSYIVQHAAGKTYSWLRRDRRHATLTTRLDDLAPRKEEDESDAEIVDPPAPQTVEPAEDIIQAELEGEILERLTPSQRRVFESLREGWTRPEIGSRMGLSRQTIHDHVAGIRAAAIEAIKSLGDEQALAEVGRRSTYRRRADGRQIEPLGALA